MRKLILFAALALFTFPAFAQEHKVATDDVPLAVKQAFQDKYPGKVVTGWELEADHYEAEYKVDGTKYEAEFDAKGMWILTEYKVKMADIPQPVKDAWKKTDYTKWNIVETKHIETPTQPNLYEYEVKKGKQTMEIQFMPDGTQVNNQAK
jgi:hypothetical protein